MIASIIFIVVILYFLAIMHELGHLLAARLLGFQVPIFGIGLPVTPYLTFLKTEQTEFRMHLVPIGVYAEIPELDPAPTNGVQDHSLKHPFRQFSLFSKVVVVFAGVATSFLIGLFILNGLFMILGQPETKLTIPGLVAENPIARDAGVLPGDEIIGLDSEIPKTTLEVIEYLNRHPSQSVKLRLRRQGKDVDCSITPNESGKVGIQITESVDESKPARRLSLLESLQQSVVLLSQMTDAIIDMLRAMSAPGGTSTTSQKPSYVGVIGVAEFVREHCSDARRLAMITAMLCFDFGAIYCLPLPGLDGGHLLCVILNHLRSKSSLENKYLRRARVAGLALACFGSWYVLCLLRGRTKPGN